MTFVLNSRVRIGDYHFSGVNECTIKKNVHSIVDTAVIKIGGKCRVKSLNAVVADAVSAALAPFGLGQPSIGVIGSSFQTAGLFKEGDPVAIDLGYNGNLRNEFRGFVRRVNITTPITIEMEGYAWQLRQQTILASWKNTNVKQVLTRIIQGTDIILSPDIPDIPLPTYYIPNKTGLQALDDLQHKMLLTIYFADNVLYAGIEEGRTTVSNDGSRSLLGLANVTYDIGQNCVTNQPDLKRRLAAETPVLVRIKSKQKTGKNIIYEAGDKDGAVYETNYNFVKDAGALQRLAEARLKQLKYDGYEGKIIGFLQPFCLPGWKATILDQSFANARAGVYFIPGTEVTFGIRGARRKVDISYRLDAPAT